nr:hypothetical protein Iba_chr03dCG5420 [Ipomoea batatas]
MSSCVLCLPVQQNRVPPPNALLLLLLSSNQAEFLRKQEPLQSAVLRFEVVAAPTKEGKMSSALSRELMIGHESCCCGNSSGAISVGRNGSFEARPCSARNKEMARILIRKRDLKRTAMAGVDERYDDGVHFIGG